MIPERLYGREREIETLLASFNRVVASGTPELLLVSGYSGIGKSSVVTSCTGCWSGRVACLRPASLTNISATSRMPPWSKPSRALVRSFLGQSEAELSRWRDAMREALGPNGQLIVNLIPELELVIGKQPPVPELPPQEEHRRFQTVFRRFLSVFARAEHPLVLFLDDLQWLDLATLELVQHLVTESEVRYFLLVGAYRDNEVVAITRSGADAERDSHCWCPGAGDRPGAAFHQRLRTAGGGHSPWRGRYLPTACSAGP